LHPAAVLGYDVKMTQCKQHAVVQRIVSGGQTGVDRGALDAAIELGIEHGGWCPQGRIAEDGVISADYRLREAESPEYPVRTERNIVDSDGTLIFFRERLFGGTELTRRLAVKCGKPHFLVDLSGKVDHAAIRQWLTVNKIRVLNVAGPRESNYPGIGQAAREAIRLLLSDPAPLHLDPR
jgi:hypothetical protein